MIRWSTVIACRKLALPGHRSPLSKSDVPDRDGHELAHWLIATPANRRDRFFGLGDPNGIRSPTNAQLVPEYAAETLNMAWKIATGNIGRASTNGFYPDYNHRLGPSAMKLLTKRRLWPPPMTDEALIDLVHRELNRTRNAHSARRVDLREDTHYHPLETPP